MSAVLYGSPETGWDGGRDAPDPNCGGPTIILRCVNLASDLCDNGQQAALVERLGHMRRKANFQTPSNVVLIDAATDGNGRYNVALHPTLRTRTKLRQ